MRIVNAAREGFIKMVRQWSFFGAPSDIWSIIRPKKQPMSLLLFVLIHPAAVLAAEPSFIDVAVASNFAPAARALVKAFEASETSGKKGVVRLIVGSTGKHYAQIKNGAPFDLFFAADEKHPMLLEKEGLVVLESRFTYAIGRIVLWAGNSSLQVGQETLTEALRTGKFSHLAIANPRLAPYGVAAKEVLEKMNLWDRFKNKIVRGENIGQTYQFVASGNAQLGFVALSQVISSQGSYWLVPESFYKELKQQAVILNEPNQLVLAQAFVRFVQSGRGREIIQRFGYRY